ncbi:MAG: biotin--[acetyl-CoA-carboxylase] ligase [Thermodesulfovibrionales bacterium]|nr:biotin--[acetyl-CoA-carboxylase] ligase [Thermodesulfovibrionales bacterium]
MKYKDNSVIIKLLKEHGNYISGSQIASVMGISRVAVWKRINSLKKKGYSISANPMKGYKLLRSPDLSMDEIKEAFSNYNLSTIANFLYYETLPSTNNTATELALKGYPEWTIIVADRQTHGRGRMGRSWFSPPGKNIYMSIILKPSFPPREMTILTIMSAVACCKALRKIYTAEVFIKWPNDLLVNEKKLGGILTEIKADSDKISYAILGIGINVNLDQEELSEDIEDTATSLKILTGKQYKRTSIIIEILRELYEHYEILLKKGKQNLLAQWKQLNCTLGKRVKVYMGKEIYEGLAETIDDEGLLIVKLQDSSLIKVSFGDIKMLREIK